MTKSFLNFFQRIEWRFGQDEFSFNPVQKVFELLSVSGDNSSIFFRPFPSNKYLSRIHSTLYQCVAANVVGVVASPVIDVRAGMTFFEAAADNNYSLLESNFLKLVCQVQWFDLY